MIRNILAGKAYPACPVLGFGMVDVRDVAAAHCLAMVHPAAEGRCARKGFRGLGGADAGLGGPG